MKFDKTDKTTHLDGYREFACVIKRFYENPEPPNDGMDEV